MKTTMKHCASLLLAIATIATLVSCSNENDVSDGDRLPDGKYPVTFTATGLEVMPTTRATAEGTWNGNEAVAVKIGSEVKKYTAQNSGTTTTLEGTDTENKYYWESKSDIDVSAWHLGSGYNTLPTLWYVNTNQSGNDGIDGYQQSDFLYAHGPLSFDGSKSLTFYHQTARVVVNILKSEVTGNITDVVIGSDKNLVIGANYEAPTGSNTIGTWNLRSDEGVIQMKKTATPTDRTDDVKETYAALVIPQDMSEKKFIAVTINANDTYYFTPKTNEANLLGGKQYTYDITVTNGYLEVTMAGESGAWGDTGTGSEAVTGKVVETGYTASEPKLGDYLYTDGTTSDGGLRARYADGTVKWAETKPIPETGKTLAAIVFWTPKETNSTGRTTPASLTDDKIMAAAFPNCNRGLAVALKDVSAGVKWQNTYIDGDYATSVSKFQQTDNFSHTNKNDFVLIVSGDGTTDAINKIYGYQNTQVLLAYNKYCVKNSYMDYIVNPVNALANFTNSNPAPKGSTGWFFPSAKELHMLCYKDVDDVYNAYDPSFTTTRDIVNNSLEAAGCETLGTSYYWSSLEFTGFTINCAISVNFSNSGIYMLKNKSYNEYRVLAVCAF